MLDESLLLRELERFGNPSANTFEGFPRTRVQARRELAHAFAAHLQGLAETAPVLAPVASSLLFSRINEAFFETVQLDNPSAEHAADDLARAWNSGVGALATGAVVTGPGGTFFTFATMDPLDVSVRFAELRAQLWAAFRSPRSNRREQLAVIANALHRAALGLRSTASPLVVTYG